MKHDLLAALEPFGQEHLLAFWERLDDCQRESLAGQIRQLDLKQIADVYGHRDQRGELGGLIERAEPPPAFRLPPAQNRFRPEQARQRGRQALAAGEVGAMLVAGGQGTRLDFHHPKGMFPIGPLSGRSLFQIHVEKIRAAARRCGVPVPLYLMTSPATHDETVAFFAAHGRFGLAEEDFFVFCQGTMPAVEAGTGRILLEAPDRVALSPDGHGGMLGALVRSGTLERIARRGIQYLFYFQVDNPLVDVCSAEFLGYHLLCGSQMTTQVIAKREPLERVGNVVQLDGRLMVVEYSELPERLARRRQPDGSLRIWAGSIAVHAFETALLQRLTPQADALPLHVARKKVKCIDPAGRQAEPTEVEAIKFERFIFDLLPAAAGAIVVEVDRAEGFAPLKNRSGEPGDTPESVRAAMAAQHRRWLRRAGVQVPDDVPVEISPLYAVDPEELAAKFASGTTPPTAVGGRFSLNPEP